MRNPRPATRWAILAVATMLVLSGTLATAMVMTTGRTIEDASSSPAAPSGAATAEGILQAPLSGDQGRIKNVVLILADDLDWNLWREIPRLTALQARGTTFTNYVVTDSLCCPSRTSIFRGQYVHNHQVLSNDAADSGGWQVFRDKGYPSDCLPTWLHAGGVRTGLIGKYLNEFPQTGAEAISVPPGWDDFVVPVSGTVDYTGYNYLLADNGSISDHGSRPQDFLNDVLDARAADFLAAPGAPFFLELASFNPHMPAPIAPRHLGSHAGLLVPRDPAFDSPVLNPPSWLQDLPAFSAITVARMDRLWQRRAESAESVADSVDAVMAALSAGGHANDTLVLVTSDNGYHVGSYRTLRGKRTAFDSDTVVPLVAIGPGVPQGRVVSAMTSETDLAPTISQAMGTRVPAWVDGRSLWPLLGDPAAAGSDPAWRTAALSESLGITAASDPDYQVSAPPSYESLRTEDWLYVEYVNGERELYNRAADPYETTNVIDTAPPEVVSALHEQLTALTACAGADCRRADAMPVPAA